MKLSLYDSLVKHGKDEPQDHENRTRAAQSFRKGDFDWTGSGCSGMDSRALGRAKRVVTAS
jgi:hypothetical protein